MARRAPATPESTIEGGFLAIAQNNVAVVHKTDGGCWEEGVTYIPFTTVEEGVSHGNAACSKCCGGFTPMAAEGGANDSDSD